MYTLHEQNLGYNLKVWQDSHLFTFVARVWVQGCRLRGRLQVVAAEKQGAPTTTKKRTTGPPILPPINDNVGWLAFCSGSWVCACP